MGYFGRTITAPFALWVACGISFFVPHLSPVAVAAPADSSLDAQAVHAPVGESAVREALERKVTVNFANQSFADVLTWLKQAQRLNVAVDGEHVDGEADLGELTVTFAAQEQPLGTALKRLLADLNLAYEIRDDVLLITTRSHESAAELRTYDVRDLVTVRGPFEDVEYDCRPLIDALAATVTRGHWTEYGADNAGALRGTLLVSQSAEAHQRIDQCLSALRQSRQRQANKAGGEPIRVEHADTAKVQAAIRRKLERPITLRFSETPLVDALGSVRDAQDLPIELDAGAMHEAGEPNDFKISLDLHDIPLRSALKRMLSRMDLAFVIREQTLLVTTSERAAETQRTVVYPVRDLLEDVMAAEGSDDLEALESLSRTIFAVVAPHSWEAQGGSGQLCPVPGAQALVCLQSDQTHAELERLFSALRAARVKLSEAAVVEASNELHTKVYKLNTAAMTDDRASADLVRLLTEKVTPQSWPREGAFAWVVGDQLIVRQTPAVLQQVSRLLRKLTLLAPHEASQPLLPADLSGPVDSTPTTPASN